MKNESRLQTILLLMLAVVVLLLVVVVIGLFIKMMQLQSALTPMGSLQPETGADEGLAIGTQFPPLALPNVDGGTTALEDFAGRKILLVFSSTTCPACAGMYPHLQVFSENNPDVQVVMVSLGSLEDNRGLVDEWGFAFPILPVSDWRDEAMQAYQVPGTPFAYGLDEQGVIVNEGFVNTMQQMEALIAANGQ